MKDRINNDMKEFMKSKDTFKLTNVRLVKGAIQLEEINKKRELTDEEIVDIISKQVKLRRDSIVEFQKGNRADLVEKTQAEVDFLMTYLPVQLTEVEINQLIDEVFEKVNPSSIKDLGAVMKELTPLIKGKADMSAVSNLVKSRF